MTQQIDDGGPAFPVDEIDVAGGHYDNRYEVLRQHPGMSLRDWFAGTVTLPPVSQYVDGWNAETLSDLVGRELPQWSEQNRLAVLQWYADAEAALRYLKADALIAERKRLAKEKSE